MASLILSTAHHSEQPKEPAQKLVKQSSHRNLLHYTCIDDIREKLQSNTHEIVYITGVSPNAFQDIDKKISTSGRRFRLKLYSAKDELLTILFPRRVHEILHIDLYSRVVVHIDRQGLDDSWSPAGATRYTGLTNTADSGEGDSAGGPVPERQKGGDWPTLIIEAGNTQSWQEMLAKRDWWFSQSNHQVKIVILTKFFKGTRESQDMILIEQWVENIDTPTIGTHNAPRYQPHRVSETTITYNASEDMGNLSAYTVSSDALCLRFDNLFLRQPMGNQHNITISENQLQVYARRVWNSL